MRRSVLVFFIASATLSAQAPPFSIVETTIPEMQRAMAEGRVTSRQLVQQSLIRIAMYEERLNAVLAVNGHALEQADTLDRERKAGKVRGPLHGVPIAIKDNINTTEMPTTGGALAFEGYVPPYEATVTKLLREAGAVIVAKTVMTELANWVAGGPTPMPANYSALGGFGRNPYDTRRDPREGTNDGRPAMSTGGSSSGIGTAASLWAANVGTETSGSILSPANQTMLVGIKPTLGRISRYGIIPITADQDTAGPIARTVTDAAILLGVLEGEGPDPNDPATARCDRQASSRARPASVTSGRYAESLDPHALQGARIGIPRAFFYDEIKVPGRDKPTGGISRDQRAVMDEAIALLKAQGAVIVDPADIPSVLAPAVEDNFVAWGVCAGTGGARGQDAGCSVVFKYGMKRDFNAWLTSLGGSAPLKTLTELRLWNLAHAHAGSIKYGQSNLDISDEMDLERDKARYEADRAKDIRLAGANGIDAAMATHNLDALLFPGASGAAIAARPGYPTVIVPFASVPNAPTPKFPDGFDARPAPFGIAFAARACSEPRLIALAYAFEQATRRRVPPPGVQ
jgi:amidase